MVLVLVYDDLGKDIRSDVIAAYDGNRGGSLDYLRVGRILVRFAAKDRALGAFHPKLCGIAVQRAGDILAAPQGRRICILTVFGFWPACDCDGSGLPFQSVPWPSL